MMPENIDPPEMTPQEANVHKALFEVIEFSKKQQWSITNYLILIYGAIFGIGKFFSGPTVAEKIVFTALTLLALGCAAALLVQIQSDMGRARERLEEISKHWFTADNRERLGLKPYANPALRGVWFLIALIGVGLVGAALVIYSLWR